MSAGCSHICTYVRKRMRVCIELAVDTKIPQTIFEGVRALIIYILWYAEEVRTSAGQWPLECVTTRWLCAAIRRVSECSGLPPDGHSVFAVIQGKVSFLHFGPDRDVTFEAIESTDSTWKLPGHRACVFIVGHSAAGKDTVLSILRTIDEKILRDPDLAGKACTNIRVVGHPTYCGLISALRKGTTLAGTSCLCWYNSELKACIGLKEGQVKEEHLCQVGEGTEVGKRNQDEELIVKPNVFFAIGAQIGALLERFGSTDNGRMRAFTTFLDSHACVKIGFVSKFLMRSVSFGHIADVVHEVASSQQKMPPVVTKNVYSPETFTIHAALHDAANKVLEEFVVPDSTMAAMIKFIGKGFGTLAAAANAARSCEWRVLACPCHLSTRRAVLADPVIRFEDGLAAAVQTLKHIGQQVYVELQIRARAQGPKQPPKADKDAAGADMHIPDLHKDYTPVVNACRRLLDWTATRPDYSTFVDEHGFSRTLAQEGWKYKLKTLRHLCFSKGKQCDVHRYRKYPPALAQRNEGVKIPRPAHGPMALSIVRYP